MSSRSPFAQATATLLCYGWLACAATAAVAQKLPSCNPNLTRFDAALHPSPGGAGVTLHNTHQRSRLQAGIDRDELRRLQVEDNCGCRLYMDKDINTIIRAMVSALWSSALCVANSVCSQFCDQSEEDMRRAWEVFDKHDKGWISSEHFCNFVVPALVGDDIEPEKVGCAPYSVSS